MSGKTNNIPENREEKTLSDEELQVCELYVNGGLEYAGRPKRCYVEVFGEKAVKNPHSAANYLIHKPHVLAHIKALLSSERFEMETMAVKLQVAETLKAVMDETATTDYTDRFGVPLSPAPLRAVSVNAAKALMEIFPSNTRRRTACVSREVTGTSFSMSSYPPTRPRMKNRKIDRKEIAWWVYLAIMIALVIYGFWNSEAAETLLRAIREAFTLLME